MSRRYAVCTSFSFQGYQQYGQKFLSSFLAHWDVPLVVFHEGFKPPIEGPIYHNLLDDDDCRAFIARHRDNPKASGLVERNDKTVIDYRFQALKFGRKVFAMTSPLRPDCDTWIWLDADTVTTRDVTPEMLEEVCPPQFVGSYLGRMDWHHSECGFVTFNKGEDGFGFLDEFRRLYTTDAMMQMAEWHDSYVFDVLRQQWAANEKHFKNIAGGIPGNHVWPATPLGRFMVHNKGPEAKLEAYS